MSGRIVFRNRLDIDVPQINWSALTPAGASLTGTTGQLSVRYDPLSGQIYYYGTDAGGIYSTAIFFAAISGSTITFTKLAGTGGGGGCGSYPDNGGAGTWNNGAGSALQPFLADRHPETMNAVDTTRNRLLQYSGLACGNPVSGDGLYYRDHWYVNLNATIASVTLEQETIATKPDIYFTGSICYAPAYDVFLLHGQAGAGGGGFAETWVFGPTNAGTLSAAQTAAGCASADDWSRTYQPGSVTPSGSNYANLEWDPVTNRALLFRMIGPSNPWNAEVASYHPTDKTWTSLSVENPPSNVLSAGHPKQCVTRITSGRWAGKFLYLSSMDATGVSSGARTYLFNSSANSFHETPTDGTGPQGLCFMTFASNIGTDGALVVYESGVGWFKGVLQ